MFRLEHNVETGEVLEIELTDAELKAFADDALRVAQSVADNELKAIEKASQKAALLD